MQILDGADPFGDGYTVTSSLISPADLRRAQLFNVENIHASPGDQPNLIDINSFNATRLTITGSGGNDRSTSARAPERSARSPGRSSLPAKSNAGFDTIAIYDQNKTRPLGLALHRQRDHARGQLRRRRVHAWHRERRDQRW